MKTKPSVSLLLACVGAIGVWVSETPSAFVLSTVLIMLSGVLFGAMTMIDHAIYASEEQPKPRFDLPLNSSKMVTYSRMKSDKWLSRRWK